MNALADAPSPPPTTEEAGLPAAESNHGFAVFAALAICLLFFLNDHGFTTSLASAYTRTPEEMQSEARGGNAVRQVCVLLFASLGLTALFGRSPNGRSFGFSGLLLTAFVGLCLASLLWAETPTATIRRGFVLACFSLAALGMARRLTGRQLLKIAVVVPAVHLGVGVATELALGTFRPWASDYRFAGTVHPNTQGLQLAALCFAAVLLARSERRAGRWWLAFSVGLTFLLLTKSRTSAAGILFSLGLLWAFGARPQFKIVAGLAAAWALSGVLIAALLMGVEPGTQASQLALMGRGEQSESLTGRLPIWAAIGPFLAAKPLLGWGYESFWTPAHIQAVTDEVQWGVREAHNAYLETVLGTGLVGLGLLMLGLLAGWAAAGTEFVRTGRPVAGFAFALVTFGLINACTESGMVMPIFTPFLLGTALLHLSFFPDAAPTCKESAAVSA